MNTASTLINRQHENVRGGMRSRQGFWGAILILAMLPLTLLYQTLFAYGSGTFMHGLLAAGSVLISFAVFDFNKLPKWVNWIGCLLAWVSATIFFLQGLSDLIPNSTLAYVAYDFLGQYIEFWSVTLFILVWCGALLLLDSQGKTRVFGFVVMASFIAGEVYRMSLAYVGAPPNGYLKLLLLLPFVWLLLESQKGQAES